MLQNTKDVSSIILMWMAIAFVSLLVLYLGISVWGNIALSRANNTEVPEMPAITKAPYQVDIYTTGQTLLAKEYVTIKADKPAKYDIVHYYTIVGNEWLLVESTLPIDEYYWGEIIIKQRVK